MEKKQLNFSAPLMSARRYSSPIRPSRKDNQRDFPSKDLKTVQSRHSDHNMDEVVKPGSVPFVWERTPGKAKGGNESRVVTSPQELPSTPKLPPGRTSGHLNGLRTPTKLSGELCSLRSQNKFSRFSGEIHSLKPYNKFSGEVKTVSNISWNDVMASFELDYDDSVFSDALETWSQLESFSVSCSMSGLNSSETVCNDEKPRAFMMDRFLPAAKALTLEPSQYASRKQLEPKEVQALAPRANTPPPRGNVCHIVPYTGQDIGSEDSEEEDDSSYDGQSGMSNKVKYSRFFPWFCSKSSLCLLNPLPTMKYKSRISAIKISRLVKSGSLKSPTRKLAKHVPCSSNHLPKVHTSFKSCELQKPTYTSRPMFYSGELQTRSGSPYRSFRRSNASPYRVESPRSFYQSDNVSNLSKLTQKDSKRYEESRRSSRLSGTRSPVVEKGLYIDPVNITKVSHSILNLPKTKKWVDKSSKENESSFENGGRMAIMKARGLSGHLDYNGVNTNVSSLNSRKSELSEALKMGSNRNLNTCRELVSVKDNTGDAMQPPLTPPLPKSPSESWLSRNLASVSPRNSVSYLSLNSKLQSRKQNAKWETIVKSSHLHHDHGRYSEELVTHVP